MLNFIEPPELDICMIYILAWKGQTRICGKMVACFVSSNLVVFFFFFFFFRTWWTHIYVINRALHLLDIISKQLIFLSMFLSKLGERGGSVVECRTPEREVRGSRPTAAVLCPWARHFTPRKYWLITQEAMAPSRYDWKIVDWDVKPQHNQPKSVEITGYIQAHSTFWTLKVSSAVNNLCFANKIIVFKRNFWFIC